MGFISKLSDLHLFPQWIPILDMLFLNDRFSPTKGWTPSEIGLFTKRLKKLGSLSGVAWTIDCQKNIEWDKQSDTIPHITMSGEDSDGRSFLRHIRNAIVHSNADIQTIRGKDYMIIKDYSIKDPNNQTADMIIPLDSINEIYELHQEVELGTHTPRHIKKTKKKRKVA